MHTTRRKKMCVCEKQNFAGDSEYDGNTSLETLLPEAKEQVR
jgi:hypothetical protein